MNADEYREAIAKLGLSQVKAGAALGADERTSRRWAREGPPNSAAVALAAFVLLKEMGVDAATHPAIQAAKSPPTPRGRSAASSGGEV